MVLRGRFSFDPRDRETFPGGRLEAPSPDDSCETDQALSDELERRRERRKKTGTQSADKRFPPGSRREKEPRKLISFNLPLADWKALRREAARQKIPMTELCRRWMNPQLQLLRR